MESKKYRVEFFIIPQVNVDEVQRNSAEVTRSTHSTSVELNLTEKHPEIGIIQPNSKQNIINDDSSTTNLNSPQEVAQIETNEDPQTRDTNPPERLANRTNHQDTNQVQTPVLPSEELNHPTNPTPSDNIPVNNNSSTTDPPKCRNLRYVEEHIYDEPFIGNLYPKKAKNLSQTSATNTRYLHRYLPRPPRRSSSLKSIDETMEILEQTVQDICYHGHLNGCTVAAQQPEEVSQEIFKENWLQKLEALRQREALLRDKELALQSQERLLFKKERQLRILERLVKDKMRQAELYLKRCKQLPGFEKVLDVERSSESGFSHSSKDSKYSRSEVDKETIESDEVRSVESHIYDEIKMKNPPNSTSSLVATSVPNLEQKPVAVGPFTRSTKFNSFRFKQKPKLSYDDLDSTLSADVGDSSFGVTAKKFNPDIFKKPMAFQKTVGERKPSFGVDKIPNFNDAVSRNDLNAFNETKILKKFSENVIASQNKNSKFQNYGLIDNDKHVNSNGVRPKSANEADSVAQKKNSQTNTDREVTGDKVKSLKRGKQRPTSWNAENDDWLQKKRQEYNMSLRRGTVAHNKENRQSEPKIEKHDKAKKDKREVKSRKFAIFR